MFPPKLGSHTRLTHTGGGKGSPAAFPRSRVLRARRVAPRGSQRRRHSARVSGSADPRPHLRRCGSMPAAAAAAAVQRVDVASRGGGSGRPALRVAGEAALQAARCAAGAARTAAAAAAAAAAAMQPPAEGCEAHGGFSPRAVVLLGSLRSVLRRPVVAWSGARGRRKPLAAWERRCSYASTNKPCGARRLRGCCSQHGGDGSQGASEGARLSHTVPSTQGSLLP
jgi:hypothetical protein